MRASFIPADDSALSATAQALDYLVTPSRLLPGSHLWTGTTGSVVKIWLPASSSTATPVNIPSPAVAAVLEDLGRSSSGAKIRSAKTAQPLLSKPSSPQGLIWAKGDARLPYGDDLSTIRIVG